MVIESVVHALIRPVGFLLRQKRAETAVALRAPGPRAPARGRPPPSPSPSSATAAIVRIEGALRVVVFGLVVRPGRQVVHGVEIAHVSSHTYVLSSDIEKAQFSQVIDEQMTQSNTLSRLLQGIFMAVYLRQYGTKLHLEPCDYDKFSHSIAD